jgi:hypothetical protein
MSVICSWERTSNNTSVDEVIFAKGPAAQDTQGHTQRAGKSSGIFPPAHPRHLPDHLTICLTDACARFVGSGNLFAQEADKGAGSEIQLTHLHCLPVCIRTARAEYAWAEISVLLTKYPQR